MIVKIHQIRECYCWSLENWPTKFVHKYLVRFEVEPFSQIGRRLNIENALGRACCSFPILSHSRPGDLNFFLKIGKPGLLITTIQLLSNVLFQSTNTTVAHHNTFPHIIKRPETLLSWLTPMCMLESKHRKYHPSHETEHISGWWRISEEEKVSDHGENKNSPLHTGWRHISRGWSKKKQLEMPGYAETKTIFIGILVYNDTNDSS